MVERCYFFNPRQFRLKTTSFYAIMRIGRMGVRPMPYGTINSNFEKIECFFYKLKHKTQINSLDSLNKVMFYYNI